MGPTRPQIVLYEAPPNGAPKLTGADFLVYADAWDAIHPGVTPQLMDRSSITSRRPIRFGLPAFYTLHVWAWKQNPKGGRIRKLAPQGFVPVVRRPNHPLIERIVDKQPLRFLAVVEGAVRRNRTQVSLFVTHSRIS